MHHLEPFYNWDGFYSATDDERSPFYGTEYNLFHFENAIYGYLIHPQWDFIGSETLYLKVLFTDYDAGYTIIELFGEWNDTLHNDIMHLKRNLIDFMLSEGINKYILIAENVFNFHGNEDDYYAEWFEDVEDGWIAMVNPRDFIETEFARINADYYINFGGGLNEIDNWRTLMPQQVFMLVAGLITHRLL
jgi:hypothetical protein